MRKAEEVVRDGVARFIESAQEYVQIKLDGSLKSLIGVAAVLHKYHEWYLRGAAANDPDHEKFAAQTAFWATCYVGDVLTKQFKGQWNSMDGNVAVTVAGTQFPLHALMLEEIRTGKKHSILIVKQIDNLLQKNAPKPEITADDGLGPQMRSLAEGVVKEVKTMLKTELDYTPASLATVDQAL